jgi:hypothetical protein
MTENQHQDTDNEFLEFVGQSRQWNCQAHGNGQRQDDKPDPPGCDPAEGPDEVQAVVEPGQGQHSN